MATLEELKELYGVAKYREIIAAEDVNALDYRDNNDAEKLLQLAWAYHQIGEYHKSLAIFEKLMSQCSSEETSWEYKVYMAAARGVAHGLIQTGGDFERVEVIMKIIPPSLDQDNVYVNAFLAKARRKEMISSEIVMGRINAALIAVPYKTISGHVISNGVLALHEARQQEDVKNYIPILPGLIDMAIGIYESTGTAKNHIAGAEFRAAQILRANGWDKFAILSAEESVNLWKELVSTQDGERYQNNLEGAEKLLNELRAEAMGKIPPELS
jgi:tetratricopeptide (TPR) repeat protein